MKLFGVFASEPQSAIRIPTLRLEMATTYWRTGKEMENVDVSSVGNGLCHQIPLGNRQYQVCFRFYFRNEYIQRGAFCISCSTKLKFYRTNSFEVRAVDGRSSGIVHCEDTSALEQWISHISKHILSLNQKSIKMSNKYLHQSEQVSMQWYDFNVW